MASGVRPPAPGRAPQAGSTVRRTAGHFAATSRRPKSPPALLLQPRLPTAVASTTVRNLWVGSRMSPHPHPRVLPPRAEQTDEFQAAPASTVLATPLHGLVLERSHHAHARHPCHRSALLGRSDDLGYPTQPGVLRP